MKTERIEIRLTKTVKDKLRSKAQAEGITLTDFITNKIIKK